MALRVSFKKLVKVVPAVKNVRFMTHYPVNDDIFGLTDEQKQVFLINFT